MFDFVVKKSSALILGAWAVCLVASSAYIFNPAAPWNKLMTSLPVPAPETQPKLGIEPIHQFFALLGEDERWVYFYYEGFVDALFFLSVVGFSLCLLGISFRYNEWLLPRIRWLLILPLFLLGFELAEGVTLLSIMWLAPARVEPLLWASDFATAGKMITYALVFLVDFTVAVFLLGGLFRRAA